MKRASVLKPQLRVRRRSSKKKPRDMQRRTRGSSSLPAPAAERFGPIISAVPSPTIQPVPEATVFLLARFRISSWTGVGKYCYRPARYLASQKRALFIWLVWTFRRRFSGRPEGRRPAPDEFRPRRGRSIASPARLRRAQSSRCFPSSASTELAEVLRRVNLSQV